MPIKHAKLSASGSSRWLNCSGSVKAEEEFQDKGSSFAQEGTAAHELSERCLSERICPDKFLNETIEGVVVTADMVEHVAGYIAYVQSFSGEHFYEQEVDFSPWVHEGFGTSDAIVVEGSVCHIIDLKYGKGVEVSAEQNTQGMLYALGVYNDFGYMFDSIETFVIHIYQPRLHNYDTWSISLKDLLKWGEWVKLRADEALSKDAPRTAGEKQCQWCKAKATCPALADFTQNLIMSEFDDLDDMPNPDRLTNSQLKQALEAKSLIVGWLDAVEKHVTGILLEGGKFKGFKLVEGRSLRRWKDEQSAANALLSIKPEDEIYTRKLISPSQAEKLLGKKDKLLIQNEIIKPNGKPTLAPESDKRPPIGDVSDCFDIIE